MIRAALGATGGGAGARHRRPPRVAAALAGVLCLLAVAAPAGCTRGSASAVATRFVRPSPSPAPGTALPTPAAPDPARTASPTRIRIPDIGVDAPLEQLHLLADGSLGPPKAWDDAGWYADGTRPGDIGPAVIAGHVDSTQGPAIFYKLDKLAAGALIEVEQDGRWLSFRAVSVAKYPKNAFPTAAVYGPTPDPQLRLITCGGDFDRARKSYLDNTVVYAVGA